MITPPNAGTAFDFGFAADVAPADAALASLRERIAEAYRADEAATVRALIDEARLAPRALDATQTLAMKLAEAVRAERSTAGGVDALMLEFSLDSREGVALMCLAEALLRIPDAATRDRLIRDKIAPRRLAGARRRVAVAVRQRRGMGIARHRQARRLAQRGRAGAGARARSCARAASR